MCIFFVYFFFCFCDLHNRNFRWPPKLAGKWFLGKITSRLCRYPGGKKICQNHSSSHCFRDKGVFAYYAEIQDSRQKWRENNFWENLTAESGDTLGVKNFVEIALARTFSEINAFLQFTQKFKMATKSGGNKHVLAFSALRKIVPFS